MPKIAPAAPAKSAGSATIFDHNAGKKISDFVTVASPRATMPIDRTCFAIRSNTRS